LLLWSVCISDFTLTGSLVVAIIQEASVDEIEQIGIVACIQETSGTNPSRDRVPWV